MEYVGASVLELLVDIGPGNLIDVAALGFFVVGGLPQSPVFLTKKRRIISITNKQLTYWYRAATEDGDTYIEQYCSDSPVDGDANITTA